LLYESFGTTEIILSLEIWWQIQMKLLLQKQIFIIFRDMG